LVPSKVVCGLSWRIFPDYRVKRADEDPRPGLIDAQMINDLLNAELVIADLSLLNPNVFYEIGIRHMAQKPIIHMQLASGATPFDVSLYRAIPFGLKKPKDLDSARAALKKQVEAVLAEGYVVENPVTNTRGRIKLQEHATSGQKVVIDLLEGLENRMRQLEFRLREPTYADYVNRVYPPQQRLRELGLAGTVVDQLSVRDTGEPKPEPPKSPKEPEPEPE
jgi:hypothetical protein